MKNAKLILIISMLFSSFCLSSCGAEEIENDNAKINISEICSETESANITESEAVTAFDSTSYLNQQDKPINTSVSTDGETYYTLNNFVFPVSNEYKLYETGSACYEFKSVKTGTLLLVLAEPGTYSENMDILKEYSELNNAEFVEDKEYNGLCGSYYYSGNKTDTNTEMCMSVTNTDTADYNENTRFIQFDVRSFDDYEEVNNTLNYTLENIVYDENANTSELRFNTFDCPYFSITSNDKWVYGYGDYKFDHDEYYISFYHASDGEHPQNYTAFSANDNPDRRSIDEEAADYLDQDFENKKTEHINFMGYDAVEVILASEDNRFIYIIFDNGNALFNVFSNISTGENYNTLCEDSNEFFKSLVIK